MECTLVFILIIFVNNTVLPQFSDICPFLRVSKKVETASGTSAAMVFVFTIATIMVFLIQKHALDTLNSGYLQTITFILVIVVLTRMVEIILKKVPPSSCQVLDVLLPLVMINCYTPSVIILATQKDYDLLTGVAYVFPTAIGFGLVLILFAGLRGQMSLVSVLKGMQGTSTALITVGLLAIAFMGFSDVVKV